MNQQNKAFVWITIFLIEVAIVAYLQRNHQSSAPLRMTQSQFDLTSNAIDMTIKALDMNGFDSTEDALSSLSGELPKAVQDEVLQRIGTPKLSDLKEVLTTLRSSIVVSESGG